MNRRIKTSEDYPIKRSYYYIVDFSNYYRLRVYPVYFVNLKTAKRALERTITKLKVRKHYFQVVTGKSLVDVKIPYIMTKRFKATRYDYPKEKTNFQDRKSYRTLLRRRLRRMGLLTLIKPKYLVQEGKRQQVRIKPNTQKVANSPNTVAKVFQLERKPGKYYYLIIDKKKTKAKGVLMKIKSLRLNVKTGELKKCTVNMRSTDILIPHLLSNIPELTKHLINHESIIKKLRKKGFDCYHKTKQKEVL